MLSASVTAFCDPQPRRRSSLRFQSSIGAHISARSVPVGLAEALAVERYGFGEAEGQMMHGAEIDVDREVVAAPTFRVSAV